jgi:hypothetical protein
MLHRHWPRRRRSGHTTPLPGPAEKRLFDPPRESTRGRLACGLAASVPLHALLAAVVVWWTWIVPVAAPREEERRIEVALVSREDIAEALGDQPLSTDAAREFDAGDPGHATVGGFDFDLELIRQRKEALFPFLTAELTFLSEIRDGERRREPTLGNPVTRSLPSAARPPLVLSDEELQRAIDRAWSRRHRWPAFQETVMLASRHDANQGRLPELLRGYVEQNILQPYCDNDTREPRFWAMLQNAAEHAEFIEFVAGFAREHPSSRSTTELLFVLDELVEASRDALLLLLTIDPRELGDTARSHPEGVGLAGELQRHYRDRTRRQGLTSTESITAWFDALRLHLLTTIVETTPDAYRAADARFLAGQVLFSQDDLDGAREWWSAIAPDSQDSYFPEYSRLMTDLRSPGGLQSRQARRVMDALHGRWLTAALTRLRQFSQSCDTF